jgi:HAD superfamily phosphatase (TIGR01668 family)
MELGTGLRPHIDQVASIFNVDFQAINRPYVILDVDNTIAQPKGLSLLEGTVDHFDTLRATGVIKDICILSNLVYPNRRRLTRVQTFAHELHAHCIGAVFHQIKPYPFGILKALRLMGAKAEETVLVDDQLYTGIKGGNRLGLYTVCVQPFAPDHLLTRHKRFLERHLRTRW